jgi:hypothetical protein
MTVAVVAFLPMNLHPIKQRRLSAWDQLGRAFDTLPGRMAGRRCTVDTMSWRRPSRDLVAPALLVGTALGAAAVAAYMLYDRARREQVRQRISQMGTAARDRYTQLGGVSGAVHTVRSRVGRTNGDGAGDLQGRVIESMAEHHHLPPGLRVHVEGRTVYLEGEVPDAGSADAAAECAHSIEGVVAVVNHTTTPVS